MQEAAQWRGGSCFLEARKRLQEGSVRWAEVTAYAISTLTRKVCAEVPKPEWWNDEGLKALCRRGW